MGTATSVLPEVAALAVRVSGPAFATSAFFGGGFWISTALLLIAHFVLLMTLGIPSLADPDVQFAHSVVFPLIGVAFAFLAAFTFHLLRLAELVTFGRSFASYFGMNLGPKPSTGFLFVNTLAWAIVAILSDFLFEWFIATDSTIAICLLLLSIVVGYSFALLLNLVWLSGDVAAYGGSASVLRSVLVPGVYHLIAAFVIGLTVVLDGTYEGAWIAAVIVLVVLTLVTIVIYFTLARTFITPPRTGDLLSFNKIAMPKENLPAYDDQDQGDVDVETSTETNARFGAPVFGKRTNATVPLFGKKE